ncbi:hypothetical protein FPSE_02340 [Fusarium pseudograminearum CS3096]|uniref:Nephrocystin 3-like N-terminal domain-containing protein n=1 Tax=Fusarium pseudograminearum (strain CS3096) TaxID=1028729 RepID=K3VPW5_FUSPC|nr:hypothetical protein FPSE_02340 [Fusarium pseudograminearum CS3096]EKJ77467.1 hypothetical protein FPSE_02340 [Fusarium pseudograminearum CS3096]
MMHTQPVLSRPSRRPQIELHTPEVDFIENRLTEYHPAFDVSKVRYSKNQGQFVAIVPPCSQGLTVPNVSTPSQARPMPAPIAEMEFWDNIFVIAMKRLDEESNIKSKWSIRHLSKWDDIQARLEDAQNEYNFNNQSKTVGKARRAIRNILDNHHSIPQQIGKVVPNSEIAGPIVGVINLMVDVSVNQEPILGIKATDYSVEAYSKASEVRDEVTSSLESLPACFAKIDLYLQTFEKDENVIKASTDLVVAVFEAVECSIKFYTSVQATRAVAAIFGGKQYQANLVQSLASIKSSCDELENQARMSFYHCMKGDNERMSGDLSSIIQGNTMTHVGLGAIMHEQHAQTESMLWVQNLVNQVFSLLKDQERNWLPHSPCPSRPLTPQPLTLPVLTPRQLWSQLSIPNLDEVDLQHIAGRAEEMFQQDRGRAQQIVTMSLFRSWIDSAQSTKLLIHGSFRAAGDVSPLSTLCTVLSLTFRQTGRFISLVFFCGRHLVWDDYHGGAVMIRSLIAQVLRQYPTQYLSPEVHSCLRNMGDIDTLCDLFRILLGQIPPSIPVVCLIDGINRYETEEYLDDMATVILRLVELVDVSSHGRNTCFKLLLASSLPTREVQRVFGGDQNALLHMENVPVSETTIGLNLFQEQLDHQM